MPSVGANRDGKHKKSLPSPEKVPSQQEYNYFNKLQSVAVSGGIKGLFKALNGSIGFWKCGYSRVYVDCGGGDQYDIFSWGPKSWRHPWLPGR